MMRNIIKKIVAAAMTVLLLFGPAIPVKSQMVTLDPSNLATNIVAWIDSINNVLDHIHKTQIQIEKVKQIYNECVKIFTGVKEVQEIYNSLKRLENAILLFKDYMAVLQNYKRISPQTINNVLAQIDRIQAAADALSNNFVELAQKNTTDMTLTERIHEAREALKPIDDLAIAVLGLATNSLVTSMDRHIASQGENIVSFAVSAPASIEVKERTKKMLDEAIKGVTLDMQRGTTGDNNDLPPGFEESAGGGNIFTNAINLVSGIIGLMAAIMAAWGYARYAKGESQHTDALWKVFAGLIFIILLLQLIQVAIVSRVPL